MRKLPLAMLFVLALLATLVVVPATTGPAALAHSQAAAVDETAGPGHGHHGAGKGHGDHGHGRHGYHGEGKGHAHPGHPGKGPDERGPDYVFDAATPLGGTDTTPLGEGEPLSTIEAEGVETVQGEIAGAGYLGQRPDDWNGEVVVWAHGFRGEGERLWVDAPPARQWLLDNGYAWIASSYRRNDYDPGIGVFDTKKVTRRAASLWGQPSRTYLAGVSMGGHVIGAAIERFPHLYDGALPACGVMGDVELFDYFFDYNLGAAAIAGVGVDYPSETWLDVEVPAIKSVLSSTPEGVPDVTESWAAGGFLTEDISTLTEHGELFKEFVEVRSGGERGVIYDGAWDYWHLGASPSGDFFFELGAGDGTIANRPGIVGDNADTDYASFGEEFAFLNDEIERVEGGDRVRKGKGPQPAPIIDGDPSIPVLTIHTIGDLFVPIEMQLIYADEVEANGRSELLVQRAIRDVGHCTFSESEWVRSYTDLFAWVDTGDAPEGDDLRADLDDPLLGCDWTITDDTLGDEALRVFPCP